MPHMISEQQQTALSDFDLAELPRDFGLVQRMHELVSEHPDFEVLGEPSVDVYCFRYLPNGFVARQDDLEVQALFNRLNQEIVEMVRRSGFTSVRTTNIGSCVAIQISICELTTVADRIDGAFEAIARWGRLLNKKYSFHTRGQSEVQS